MAPVLAEPVPFADRLADRINPVTLKELRQAVNSRFINGMLIALLGVMLAVLVGYAVRLGPEGSPTRGDGAPLFGWFQLVLLVAAGAGLPLYAGLSLAVERASAAGDLLLMTALRPRQVVLGKFNAGLVIAALIASACVPFIVISWILRGVGIVTILWTLLFDVAVVASALSLAIMVGSTRYGPIKKLLFAVFSFVGVPALFAVVTFGCIGNMDGGGEVGFWVSTILFFTLLIVVPLSIATEQVGPPPPIRPGDLRYDGHARRLNSGGGERR